MPTDVSGLVMTGTAPATMLSDSVAVPVPCAFVALRVTLNVPAAEGVPEMRPFVVLTARPAGSPVALKLAGLLIAVVA